MEHLAEFLSSKDIVDWAFQKESEEIYSNKKCKLNNQLPQISSSATINRACQKQFDKKPIERPQSRNKELVVVLKNQNKQLREMIQQHKELLEQLKE